jgi:hypothetical protein
LVAAGTATNEIRLWARSPMPRFFASVSLPNFSFSPS